MKFLKRLTHEHGYLLLESLLVLMIITTLLLVVYPLLAEWFVIREKAKHDVELSRVLYESSYNWPQKSFEHSSFKISSNSTCIFVESLNQEVGVEIYDKNFKR